jgi:hypothetical protein
MVKSKSRQKKYKGGVITCPNYQEPPYELFMKMVHNPTCRISKISDTSLKGFVIRLDIDPQPKESKESYFLGLNHEKTAFDVHVNTLVFKLVFLNETQESLPMYDKDGEKYDKDVTSLQEYEHEVAVQSEVYQATLSKGEPICPSVVASALLKDQESSTEFLTILSEKQQYTVTRIQTVLEKKHQKKEEYITDRNKHKMDIEKLTTMLQNAEEVKPMLEYLFTIVSSGLVTVGVIVMESASQYQTLHSFLNNPSNFIGLQNRANTAIYNVLFLVLRMFDETNYIHCDLHQENILISFVHRKLSIRIIDFDKVIQPYFDFNPDPYDSELHKINEKLKFIIEFQETDSETRVGKKYSLVNNYYLEFLRINLSMLFEKGLEKDKKKELSIFIHQQILMSIFRIQETYARKKDVLESSCYKVTKPYVVERESTEKQSGYLSRFWNKGKSVLSVRNTRSPGRNSTMKNKSK